MKNKVQFYVQCVSQCFWLQVVAEQSSRNVNVRTNIGKPSRHVHLIVCQIFFRITEPTQSEYDLCVQEGPFAYHTVNHSFWSMDCTSGVNRKLYCPKFSCAPAKCWAIVTQMLAPWAFDELIAEHLNVADFISLLADNHGHIKLLCLF